MRLNEALKQQQIWILNFRFIYEWKFREEFQASAILTLPNPNYLASLWLLMLIYPSAHANRKTIERWEKIMNGGKYRSREFRDESFPVVTWIRPVGRRNHEWKSYVRLTFALALVCTFREHLHNRFLYFFAQTSSVLIWLLFYCLASEGEMNKKNFYESLMHTDERHQLGAFYRLIYSENNKRRNSIVSIALENFWLD